MDNDEFHETSDFDSGFTSAKPPRHRHRPSSSRHWLISPLWAIVVLEGLVIAGLAIWTGLLQEENESHFAKEKALAQTINDGKTELEGLKWEFNEYKNQQGQSCLPNLLPLKFDQVMEINKEYVKSAMFVLSGKKDRQVLEYKFVLKNNKQKNVEPLFDIIFFNALGNQIGTSQIGYNKRGQPSGDMLERGEVRSYDGTFELTNGTHADFIMLKFVEQKEDNPDRLKPQELIQETSPPLDFNQEGNLQ